MSETEWRFLQGGWAEGAYHFAVDDALTQLCARGKSVPTLRTYNFWPLCLSLGRFQSTLREVNNEQCLMRGIDIVRRPTGGRAVLHQNDLAYSIVAPLNVEGFEGSIHRVRSLVAGALTQALTSLGASPIVVSGSSPPSIPSGICFASTADCDITIQGVKVSGSAQLHRGRAILQHGSIRLAGGGQPLHRIMRLTASAAPATGQDAGLCDLLNKRITRRQLSQAICDSFQRALGIRIAPGSLNKEETALVEKSKEERYDNPEWNWSR